MAPMEVEGQQQPVEQSESSDGKELQLRREALQQAWKCMTGKLLTDARLKELRERSLAAEEEVRQIACRLRELDAAARAEDPRRRSRQDSSVLRRSSRGQQSASTEEQVEAVDTVAASSGGEKPSDGSDRPSSAVMPPALPAGAAPVGPSTEAAAAASSSGDLNVGSGGESKPQASSAQRHLSIESGERNLGCGT